MNRNFTKSESTLSTVPIPRNTFEPFVSADAVACYVGIERRQVMQLTRAGKLPAYPLDPEAKRKAWRYKLSEVDAMISGSRKQLGQLAAALVTRDNSEPTGDGKAYRSSNAVAVVVLNLSGHIARFQLQPWRRDKGSAEEADTMLLSGAIHPCASSELGALVYESTQRKMRVGSPRSQRRKSNG